MNNKAPRDEILEAAADWCDRLKTLTPVERLELNAWIAADPAHARAYDALRRTMLDVALLDAVADLPPEPTPKPLFQLSLWLAQLFASKTSWGVLVGAAAAVCVLVVLLPKAAPPASGEPQILTTRTAERSVIALADKSVVYLNADTQIAVSYSDHARLLRLSRGEAIFQVTKDKARPFRVVTDGTTVTAVGTRFGVDRLGDAVEVRVYEGTVKVEGKAQRAVTRGQWLLIDPKQGISSGTFLPETFSNWRAGWVEADGMPLAYVVTQLNRYTDNKIVLADDALAASPMYGRFRLDNAAGSLQQIAALLNAEVEQRDHDRLLRRRRE